MLKDRTTSYFINNIVRFCALRNDEVVKILNGFVRYFCNCLAVQRFMAKVYGLGVREVSFMCILFFGFVSPTVGIIADVCDEITTFVFYR
jgi:hypothetical protein